MQYENKARMSAIFNLDVLASFAITIGLLIDFYTRISSHFAGKDLTAEVSRYAYFMVALTLISILIQFIYGILNKSRLFIWLAGFYVLSAFISTALSGMYPAVRLPFRFVDLFYWVAVMILSYYSVLSLNTAKFHIAIVMLMLPLLSYRFFVTRYTGTLYSDALLLNPVYYIAYLMPVVFLLRSRILKVSGIILIFAIIVLSYKRTAILAFLTSIMVYFYCMSRSGSKASIWRYATLSLGAFLFMVVLAFSFRYLIGAFGLDWSARMSDIAASGGSGRLGIWRDVFAALAADPAYWLFGHGHEATKLILSTGAHNDFIEILYDFGLVGLIIYLLFVVAIVRIFFKMMKLRYKHFDAFAVSLVWFAFGTMFSQLVIYPFWFLSIAMFWGITIADFENARKQGSLAEGDDSLYLYQYDDETAADVPYTQC